MWVEPYPDDGLREAVAGPDARYEQRESVELAFIAALQHLSARQRAVLILRDVLGFSGSEVAELLETSPESVYSALQRAHRTIKTRLPQQSQQAALRALGDERLQRIVRGYVDAWEHKDIDRVVAMLAEDVVMTMPPRPSWYRGLDDVTQFMCEWPMASTRPWRILPARASGQLAFGHYGWEEDEQLFMPHAVNVLRLRGERIVEIAAYLTPAVFGPLGLPTSLPHGG